MPLLVQKFGGTSVADPQKILAAARKAIRAAQAGNQVVMVVSAMGHNTDHLIDLAQQINDRPPARELDMLLSTGEQVSVALMAMAVCSLGHKATSLTGAQIGIRTDSTHTKARIQSISTDRMKQLLDEGHIVIAAGFQGIDENLNITTLGRGGSDTTAVALAAVLKADTCEIYTDVDGVYTTDPRLLPEARHVPQVSYDEMLELASLGAAVMHSRSIEFAKKFGVPIHVRSSFSDTPGTMIVEEPEARLRPVSGVALAKGEARVTVLGVPDRPGTSQAIFSRIAARNVTVDMIVQNVGTAGHADVSFTVARDDLAATLEAVDDAVRHLGAEGYTHDQEVAKVSVVGLGMASQTGVAEKMFRALADAKINLQMISTSEIKISVLLAAHQAAEALRVIHRAFTLERPPSLSERGKPEDAHGAERLNPADILRSLQRMEDLTIDEIVLDESQARVSVSNVPDQPGIATRVFEEVAKAGIFVDMIVQSTGRDGRANLSFTVPQSSLKQAVETAKKIGAALGCGGVDSAPQVAKLSVTGIGMRSHAGVATRTFEALAAAGINIEMVATSEVRVNVVVQGDKGPTAMRKLQEAFADVLR